MDVYKHFTASCECNKCLTQSGYIWLRISRFKKKSVITLAKHIFGFRVLFCHHVSYVLVFCLRRKWCRKEEDKQMNLKDEIREQTRWTAAVKSNVDGRGGLQVKGGWGRWRRGALTAGDRPKDLRTAWAGLVYWDEMEECHTCYQWAVCVFTKVEAEWKCFGSSPFGPYYKSTAFCPHHCLLLLQDEQSGLEEASPLKENTNLAPSHSPISSNTHSWAINKLPALWDQLGHYKAPADTETPSSSHITQQQLRWRWT